MSNPELRKSLVEGLVAQDAGISESQLKEFRMNLEQTLETLEQKAEASRTAMIRSIGVVFVCYVFAFVLNMMGEFSPVPQSILVPIWSLCTNAALITTTVIIVRYWSRHRPALERGRTDLQIAMFGELQRQVAELNQRLAAAGK